MTDLGDREDMNVKLGNLKHSAARKADKLKN